MHGIYRGVVQNQLLSGTVPPLAALDVGSLDLTGTNLSVASRAFRSVGEEAEEATFGVASAVGSVVGAILLASLYLIWLRARRRRLKLLKAAHGRLSVVRNAANGVWRRGVARAIPQEIRGDSFL
jgi:hypothetical protein